MLGDTIQKFSQVADSVRFHDKKSDNVESFFKDELNCEFVPSQVVEFYSNYDGATFSIAKIYPINDLKEQYTKFKDKLAGFNINYDDDKYVPIGIDGMGGYFVFSSNKEDKTIYWIDHENVDKDLDKFTDFKEFLEDRLDSELYIKENDKN